MSARVNGVSQQECPPGYECEYRFYDVYVDASGYLVDSATGNVVDPDTGEIVGNIYDSTSAEQSSQVDTGRFQKDDETGLWVDMGTGEVIDPDTGEIVGTLAKGQQAITLADVVEKSALKAVTDFGTDLLKQVARNAGLSAQSGGSGGGSSGGGSGTAGGQSATPVKGSSTSESFLNKYGLWIAIGGGVIAFAILNQR